MILNANFNINAQALAVYHMLVARINNEFSREYLEAGSAPWYNGREKGIVIWFGGSVATRQHAFKTTKHPQIVFVFGECRCSDGIFLDMWEVEDNKYSYYDGNVPNHLDEKYEWAYENEREEFGHAAVGDVIEQIMDRVEEFVRVHDLKEKAGYEEPSDEKQSPGFIKDFFEETEDAVS